ncbi:hypothetical protein [Campylobacter concisus]|nr:hypothetical protein [Campylobacter concisus]
MKVAMRSPSIAMARRSSLRKNNFKFTWQVEFDLPSINKFN